MRHNLILLSFPLLLMNLIACRSPQNPARPVRIQLTAEPVSLDPSLAEDGAALRVLANTQDGLVGYDGAGNLVPLLAERWEEKNSPPTLTFYLRKNVTWSDGTPVTSEDFKTGMERSLNPNTPSKLAEMIRVIERIDAMPGVVRLHLKHPAPYLLHALTLPVALPQRRDILEKNQGRWPESAPHTGAYQITDHQADRFYRFKKNTRYWSSETLHAIDAFEWIVVSDETTGMNLFDRGDLDVLSRVPTWDLERLEKKGVLRSYPFLATYYLAFRVHQKPFQNPQTRKKVAQAIDQQAILHAAPGSGEPARSWIPPTIEGHLPFRSDHPSAVSDSTLKMRIRVSTDAGERNRVILEKIQYDLKKKLGLDLQIEPYDWKTHVRRLAQKGPSTSELYRFGWLAPFRDPVPHLQVFTSHSPNNYTGWSSARYDRLVTEIEKMSPGKEREKKIHEAQRILVEDEAVVIPLYHYRMIQAVQPRIAGFRVNPVGVILLKELRLQ